MKKFGRKIFVSALSLSMMLASVMGSVNYVHASDNDGRQYILILIKSLLKTMKDLEFNGIQVICLIMQMNNGIHFMRKLDS